MNFIALLVCVAQASVVVSASHLRQLQFAPPAINPNGAQPGLFGPNGARPGPNGAAPGPWGPQGATFPQPISSNTVPGFGEALPGPGVISGTEADAVNAANGAAPPSTPSTATTAPAATTTDATTTLTPPTLTVLLPGTANWDSAASGSFADIGETAKPSVKTDTPAKEDKPVASASPKAASATFMVVGAIVTAMLSM